MDVGLISTPSDGSCGIGTYAGDLSGKIPKDVTLRRYNLRVNSWNPIHFLLIALTVGLSDVDVIHIQHEYGLFGPASYGSLLFFPVIKILAYFRRVPIIITLHSAWNNKTVDTPPIKIKQYYIQTINMMIVWSASHLVFLSKNCMHSFSRSVKFEDYSIFPHGVNDPSITDISVEDAKVEFGYNPDDMVVILPGYVRPEKGTDTFVEIARQFDTVQFLIAGGSRLKGHDKYLESIKRTLPDNAQVAGVLNDSEFQRSFVAADIVLLPYREMTQSGIFNWCAAYGVPVLASDHKYFEELSSQWGCVETVPASEPEKYENKLRTLLEDEERQERLATAIQTYADVNSFTFAAECHSGLYHWIIDRSHSTDGKPYQLIQWAYDSTIRSRLPRKIANLNGVPTRYAHLFDSNDVIEDYENPNVKALNNHVEQGESVVIIGGDWGVTSVVAARNVGEKGDVTTFEGSPWYAERVKETAELSGSLDTIEVVSKVVGQSVLLFDDENPEQLDSSDLPECDILQIDAEGAEIEILSNLTIQPRLIIVETHGCYGAPTKQVEMLLEQNNYDIISTDTELAERGVDVLIAEYDRKSEIK